MLTMERLNWIDNIKGFGIIMVVMGHMCLLPIAVNHFIYSFHMPLFFMITGYLYHHEESSLFYEVRLNFKRYLIPYFKIGLVCFVIWGIALRLVKDDKLFIWDGVSSLLLNGYDKVCCTPIWYLYTLFISIVIFKISLKFNFIIAISILLILSFLLANINSEFISVNSFLAAFFILVGYKTKNWPFGYWCYSLLIVIIVGVLLLGLPVNEFMHNKFSPSFVYCIIVSLLICFLLFNLFRQFFDFRCDVLSFISKNSIVFFGYNYAVNAITIKYLMIYGVNFIVGTMINVFILMIVAFLISKSRILSYLMR